MLGDAKEGWCHLSHVPLRAEASDRAECVNEVLAGESVQLVQRGTGHWVKVQLPDGYEGWMDDRQLHPVTNLWTGHPVRLAAPSSAWDGVPGGVLPAGAVVRLEGDAWKMGEWAVAPLGHEPTNHQGSMLDVAESMKGVPYHWGGRSSWGLDCSGLVQLAAMLTGRLVPRDASQQAEVGVEVHSNDLQDNDVAFFANDKGAITHVGICKAGGAVIHASGEVREDQLDGTSLVRHEDGKASHQLALVRRWTSV